MRRLLVVLGVLAMAWGARSLLHTGWHNVVATVVWLAGGVVVHDGVLGLLLVAAGVVLARIARRPARRPLAAGLVVFGTATATAVPVLGRFGARPDNATLLDRNYVVGWLVLALLVAAGTAGWWLVSVRTSRPARPARRGSRPRPSGG